MTTHPSPTSLRPLPARPATTPEAAELPPVVVCLACRRDFDAFPEAGEAAYFAAVHNGLHHGGRPEAFLTAVDEPTHPNPGQHPAARSSALGGAA